MSDKMREAIREILEELSDSDFYSDGAMMFDDAIDRIIALQSRPQLSEANPKALEHYLCDAEFQGDSGLERAARANGFVRGYKAALSAMGGAK